MYDSSSLVFVCASVCLCVCACVCVLCVYVCACFLRQWQATFIFTCPRFTQALFTTPLHEYDLLLHLRPKFTTNYMQYTRMLAQGDADVPYDVVPNRSAVRPGFNPILFYVRDLKVCTVLALLHLRGCADCDSDCLSSVCLSVCLSQRRLGKRAQVFFDAHGAPLVALVWRGGYANDVRTSRHFLFCACRWNWAFAFFAALRFTPMVGGSNRGATR